MNRYVISIFVMLFTVNSLSAQLCLPSIFADGMVLQQRSDVAIWGKATPDEKITITPDWDGKRYRVVAQSDSTWRVKIATPEGSYTPHSIRIKSKQENIEINDVLIGEVWLCGGQSNMAMTMNGFRGQPVDGGTSDILHSTNRYLRQYSLDLVSTLTPKDDCPGEWLSANPNDTGNFSATAYYFGRIMQEILDVPIGLLNCSWSGSTIESWISEEGLADFEEVNIPDKSITRWRKNMTPTVLFNGMLNSIIGYGIKGSIWYQGEANRLSADRYPDYFKAMRSDWESRWGIGSFPIYACQIAPYGSPKAAKGLSRALMREAQLRISQEQSNTGLAILLDIGLPNCIHPPRKSVVGERLALIALSKSYGFDKLHDSAPSYCGVECDGSRAILHFECAELGFIYKPIDGYSGFEVAGEDQLFYPATATITKDQCVVVQSDKVDEPIAVRYAFKDYTPATLFGVNGLPVSSFRTDDWSIVNH